MDNLCGACAGFSGILVNSNGYNILWSVKAVECALWDSEAGFGGGVVDGNAIGMNAALTPNTRAALADRR